MFGLVPKTEAVKSEAAPVAADDAKAMKKGR
jgi:hypothetical protein